MGGPWIPVRWPHDIKTPSELDQQGGTHPPDFTRVVETFRTLFARSCSFKAELAPNAMARTERMRFAYLDEDHSQAVWSIGIRLRMGPHDRVLLNSAHYYIEGEIPWLPVKE